MADRDPALDPFQALIGTWVIEASHPLFDGVAPGSIAFEWLEGGHFLIQRSQSDPELFPDPCSLIGAPEAGDGLVMEYFGSRGVRRTYSISLGGGGLRIPGFDQRYSATIGHETFEGVWQLARTPGDW